MYFLLNEDSLNNLDSDQVMVNNSTDINQQNKQSPLTSNTFLYIIEQEKTTTLTYGLGNPYSGFEQAQICG